jgi:hypothetical protein
VRIGRPRDPYFCFYFYFQLQKDLRKHSGALLSSSTPTALREACCASRKERVRIQQPPPPVAHKPVLLHLPVLEISQVGGAGELLSHSATTFLIPPAVLIAAGTGGGIALHGVRPAACDGTFASTPPSTRSNHPSNRRGVASDCITTVPMGAPEPTVPRDPDQTPTDSAVAY